MNTDPTPFVSFDVNGRIVAVGSVPQYAVKAQRSDTTDVIEGIATVDKHYVDVATRTVQQKTDSPIVMSGDVFTNIPPHSWAMVGGVRYDLTDATAEFTFDFPGEYHVTVYSVRHLPLTHTIIV